MRKSKMGGTGTGEAPSGGEYSVVTCPFNRIGLRGDADGSLSCFLSGGPDADGRGWGYDNCSFSGKDYRECIAYRRAPDAAKSGVKKND